MQAELELQSPPVAHGFRHAGDEMRTGFLNGLQSRWISGLGYMLLLMVREQPLVHPFL
jgi:hypothetical protein